MLTRQNEDVQAEDSVTGALSGSEIVLVVIAPVGKRSTIGSNHVTCLLETLPVSNDFLLQESDL